MKVCVLQDSSMTVHGVFRSESDAQARAEEIERDGVTHTFADRHGRNRPIRWDGEWNASSVGYSRLGDTETISWLILREEVK